MAAWGGSRVALALIKIPRMSPGAMMAVLPYVARAQEEDRVFRVYMSDVLRMTCENIATISKGVYTKNRYEDLISPPVNETRTKGDIVNHIKGMLKDMGGE